MTEIGTCEVCKVSIKKEHVLNQDYFLSGEQKVCRECMEDMHRCKQCGANQPYCNECV